jgi:hypothetical protein
MSVPEEPPFAADDPVSQSSDGVPTDTRTSQSTIVAQFFAPPTPIVAGEAPSPIMNFVLAYFISMILAFIIQTCLTFIPHFDFVACNRKIGGFMAVCAGPFYMLFIIVTAAMGWYTKSSA